MTEDRIYRLDEVYGVARDLPENYVIRESVDGKFVESLSRDQHIVVYGSSKQGKTCLRKYNLIDTDYINVICSNRWDLRQLHTSILKAAGYTVEGTKTESISGQYKVSAKLTGGVKALFASGQAEVGGETGQATDTTTTETPLELDASDVNDIIAALDYAKAPKFLVLEDFHYLPEETQRDFAVALKAFHEASAYCFIVVGVWLDENRLIQHNGDLTGRVIAVNADKWTPEELREVVKSGEKLLKVEFDDGFVDSLIENSFDSVWIVQEVCRKACELAGVFQTQGTPVKVNGDALALTRSAVDAHSARYNGFLVNFSVGFRDTQLKMYRWILFAVVMTSVEKLEKGMALAEIGALINSRHPDAPLNPASITQALQSVSSLQVSQLQIKPIILDYDQTFRRLNIVDRSFLIWLQHQTQEDLLESIDLAGVMID